MPSCRQALPRCCDEPASLLGRARRAVLRLFVEASGEVAIGTYVLPGCSLGMSTPKDIEKRERKIDEALKETFPASDTPTFVGNTAAERDYGAAKDEHSEEPPAGKKRAARTRR